jgi:hypothetical protein
MVGILLNLFNSINFSHSGNIESLVTSGSKADIVGKARTYEVWQGTDGFSYYLKIFSHGHEATRVVGGFASADEAIDYLNSNY